MITGIQTNYMYVFTSEISRDGTDTPYICIIYILHEPKHLKIGEFVNFLRPHTSIVHC